MCDNLEFEFRNFDITQIEQCIGVADGLGGLHAWILPNALRGPDNHHDDKR